MVYYRVSEASPGCVVVVDLVTGVSFGSLDSMTMIDLCSEDSVDMWGFCTCSRQERDTEKEIERRKREQWVGVTLIAEPWVATIQASLIPVLTAHLTLSRLIEPK